MKISRIKDSDSVPITIISMDGASWYRIGDLLSQPVLTGAVEILAYEKINPDILSESISSKSSSLHPGEFFGSGTVPGCSGIESGCFLQSADSIRLKINKIGVLVNKVI